MPSIRTKLDYQGILSMIMCIAEYVTITNTPLGYSDLAKNDVNYFEKMMDELNEYLKTHDKKEYVKQVKANRSAIYMKFIELAGAHAEPIRITIDKHNRNEYTRSSNGDCLRGYPESLRCDCCPYSLMKFAAQLEEKGRTYSLIMCGRYNYGQEIGERSFGEATTQPQDDHYTVEQYRGIVKSIHAVAEYSYLSGIPITPDDINTPMKLAVAITAAVEYITRNAMDIIFESNRVKYQKEIDMKFTELLRDYTHVIKIEVTKDEEGRTRFDRVNLEDCPFGCGEERTCDTCAQHMIYYVNALEEDGKKYSINYCAKEVLTE